MKNLIRGYNWNARMSNGAVFSFWTPMLISRDKARSEILRVANGDYGEIYSKADIDSLWMNENKRI